jgi:hypothetical protein
MTGIKKKPRTKSLMNRSEAFQHPPSPVHLVKGVVGRIWVHVFTIKRLSINHLRELIENMYEE